MLERIARQKTVLNRFILTFYAPVAVTKAKIYYSYLSVLA